MHTFVSKRGHKGFDAGELAEIRHPDGVSQQVVAGFTALQLDAQGTGNLDGIVNIGRVMLVVSLLLNVEANYLISIEEVVYLPERALGYFASGLVYLLGGEEQNGSGLAALIAFLANELKAVVDDLVHREPAVRVKATMLGCGPTIDNVDTGVGSAGVVVDRHDGIAGLPLSSPRQLSGIVLVESLLAESNDGIGNTTIVWHRASSDG